MPKPASYDIHAALYHAAEIHDRLRRAVNADDEGNAFRAALSAKDEEVKRLREALAAERERCVKIVRHALIAGRLTEHGMAYGPNWRNVIIDKILGEEVAALSPRPAAMEHIAQERAEEIEENKP